MDVIASHHPHCIGCGRDNPGSLGLRFVADGERVRATCTFDERHQGAPGFVHGGSLATAIDDTVGTLLEVTLEHFAQGGQLPDALSVHWNLNPPNQSDLPY